MKKVLVCIIVIVMLFTSCDKAEEQKFDGVQIKLSDDKIMVDGDVITNDNTQAVYSANDIVFYLAGKDFTYGEGAKEDEHQQSEADDHTVVHITKPGKYLLSGQLSAGQIAVDLGEEAKTDPDAVVTIILNGVDITCTVAPAIIFYNVYECGVADEETATKDVDTSKAGANVIVADGTENNINGSYVAKIYESYELNEAGTEVVDSKKLHKYDAAFYSKQSMNINGEKEYNGILNIKAENEGLDSELHLTINGGVINIVSGNDGINTNEDNVSVTTINGGTLNIICDGSTGEGDGIDSNGWLVINGGTVIAQECATSGDAGIDSDKGIYINAGKVVASGNMFDKIAGGEQTYIVLNFASRQVGDSVYSLKNADGKVVGEYNPTNDFTYLVVAGDELAEGDYTFWQGDTQLAATSVNGMNMGEKPEMPQGEENQQGNPPEPPEGFENMKRPQENGDLVMPDGERPEKPEGEIPEGAGDMTPPNKFGGGEFTGTGETSATFTIVKGGNQFFNISPVTIG